MSELGTFGYRIWHVGAIREHYDVGLRIYYGPHRT